MKLNTYLVSERKVSASTQNQALSASIFLNLYVLHKEPDGTWFKYIVHVTPIAGGLQHGEGVLRQLCYVIWHGIVGQTALIDELTLIVYQDHITASAV